MSSRIQIVIDSVLPEALSAIESVRRSKHFQVVHQLNDAQVLITASPQSALEAVQQNRHVLLLEPDQCRPEIRSELAASGLVSPGHPARFEPAIAAIKQALHNQSLGQPGLIRIHSWSSGQSVATALTRELDLVIWMMGEIPIDICAVQGPESLQIHLGFRSGAMTLIDLAHGVPPENHYYNISVIGDRGSAYSDDHHNAQLLLAPGGPRALPFKVSDGLYGMIDAFAHERIQHHSPEKAWMMVEDVARVARQIGTALTTGNIVHAEVGNV